jgi:hypothetical protein
VRRDREPWLIVFHRVIVPLELNRIEAGCDRLHGIAARRQVELQIARIVALRQRGPASGCRVRDAEEGGNAIAGGAVAEAKAQRGCGAGLRVVCALCPALCIKRRREGPGQDAGQDPGQGEEQQGEPLPPCPQRANRGGEGWLNPGWLDRDWLTLVRLHRLLRAAELHRKIVRERRASLQALAGERSALAGECSQCAGAEHDLYWLAP